jgi:hypothetical protein
VRNPETSLSKERGGCEAKEWVDLSVGSRNETSLRMARVTFLGSTLGVGAVLAGNSADSERDAQGQAIVSYVILGGAADTGPVA